jgi:chaperonin cofactor prefoldin
MDLAYLVNSAAGQWDNLGSWIGIGILAIAVVWLLRQVGQRLTQSFTDTFINNWRLGLLGLTGVVLSVASGWTTWDGMRNFTKEPVLSFLITFGIQGVMLIVAWLIGESFATGMNQGRRRGASEHSHPGLRMLQPIASSIAGILLFSALGILAYGVFVPEASLFKAQSTGDWWAGWWENLMIAVPVVILLTLLIVNAGSDVLEDYTQSLRIMVRSAVLWVMFLACMATSVFFSFDSLFSTIFPAEERARAAELRAQNQVAGIVNDVARLAGSRRLEEQERLFTTADWQRYDDDLEKLARLAGGAGEKLQSFFEERMRERQAELNRFQEDKSSAAAQQVALVQRKDQLNTQISRLKEQVTNLQPEVERLKGLVFEKDREVIAKTAEAEAEAGGIGVTSKIGRGPKYREIMGQLYRLREEKENLELQLRAYEKRLNDARQALTSSETELARADGEIAKLKGRAETAARMIEARAKTVSEIPTFDATTGVQQLAEAREGFRREPTAEGLAAIQNVCGALAGALRDQGDPGTRQSATAIDCDPGAASEAAARVFALNDGVKRLRETCVGGDKLPAGAGADALFGFARRCVQDAQLSSTDTAKLRQMINNIELNRDDKAHRFVVTTNAFQDGNKLAYLALAIAIAIDTLVFMSGLFGANAVRSPLSDMHGARGLSADQLEKVIDGALKRTPDPLKTIDAITSNLEVLSRPQDGFSTKLRPSKIDSELLRATVTSVLGAGATIDAVKAVEPTTGESPSDPEYLLGRGFVKYLNIAATKTWQVDSEAAQQRRVEEQRRADEQRRFDELERAQKRIWNAASPDVAANSDLFLHHCHPEIHEGGFVSAISLRGLDKDETIIVKRILNAAAPTGLVKGVDHAQTRNLRERLGKGLSLGRQPTVPISDRTDYWVHADLLDTLMSFRTVRRQAGATELGGPLLDPSAVAIADPRAPVSRQITDEHFLREAEPTAAAGEGHPNPESQAADLPRETGETDDATIQRQFFDHLMHAINANPAGWKSLPGEALGLAAAASDAFGKLRSTHMMLDWEVRDRDQRTHDSLERAQAAMLARLQGDKARGHRQLLASARQSIEQNWQIIMMLPHGPYESLLEQMIEAFERDDAEGKLDLEKRHLLKNVKAIRDALRDNPRDDAGAWLKLENDLMRISSESDEPSPGSDAAKIFDIKDANLRR